MRIEELLLIVDLLCLFNDCLIVVNSSCDLAIDVQVVLKFAGIGDSCNGEVEGSNFVGSPCFTCW